MNSSMLVRARRKGTVTYVDAERIEIGNDVYKLRKFVGLNERTCQNQKPIVAVGEKVEKGPGHRRRRRHLPGRAGPGPQRPGGLHGLGRLQLRGRHHHQRRAGRGRHLHLDPHRGVRHRNPRDQARPRGVHPRHPQRQRKGAPQPRRERHRPRGHLRAAGRHPGGQGLAEVEDRADARREAAARHLRPRRRGREERLAGSPLRRRRHRHRHAEVLPPHEPLRGRAQGRSRRR